MGRVVAGIGQRIVQVIGDGNPEHLRAATGGSRRHEHQENRHGHQRNRNKQIGTGFSGGGSRIVNPLPHQQIPQNDDKGRDNRKNRSENAEFRPAQHVHVVAVQIRGENRVGNHGAEGGQQIAQQHFLYFDVGGLNARRGKQFLKFCVHGFAPSQPFRERGIVTETGPLSSSAVTRTSPVSSARTTAKASP